MTTTPPPASPAPAGGSRYEQLMGADALPPAGMTARIWAIVSMIVASCCCGMGVFGLIPVYIYLQKAVDVVREQKLQQAEADGIDPTMLDLRFWTLIWQKPLRHISVMAAITVGITVLVICGWAGTVVVNLLGGFGNGSPNPGTGSYPTPAN